LALALSGVLRVIVVRVGRIAQRALQIPNPLAVLTLIDSKRVVFHFDRMDAVHVTGTLLAAFVYFNLEIGNLLMGRLPLL
jgi:hypothetical protein